MTNGVEGLSRILLDQLRITHMAMAAMLLEIALVISSVALLSGKKIFWKAGLVLAAVGVLVAVLGLMIA